MATKVYQFQASGTNVGVLMSNTFYISRPAAVAASDAELTACVAPLRTFYDAIKAYMCTTTTWTVATRVLELDYAAPLTAPNIRGITPGAAVLGTGGVQTINQAAICLGWRTAIAGRSYRGRTFLGVLAASTVAGGTMAAGIPTAVMAAGNALISSLGALASPMLLTVYSRKLLNITPITSCFTDQTPDVLRSRKR